MIWLIFKILLHVQFAGLVGTGMIIMIICGITVVVKRNQVICPSPYPVICPDANFLFLILILLSCLPLCYYTPYIRTVRISFIVWWPCFFVYLWDQQPWCSLFIIVFLSFIQYLSDKNIYLYFFGEINQLQKVKT